MSGAESRSIFPNAYVFEKLFTSNQFVYCCRIMDPTENLLRVDRGQPVSNEVVISGLAVTRPERESGTIDFSFQFDSATCERLKQKLERQRMTRSEQ